MEVYFLKKLILHRSNIRERNESQNIGGCSGAKLQEPLLIPPFCTSQAHFLQSKPISFNPSPLPSTWPTFHLHFQAQTKAQCNGPTLSLSFLFFFSKLQLTCHFCHHHSSSASAQLSSPSLCSCCSKKCQAIHASCP